MPDARLASSNAAGEMGNPINEYVLTMGDQASRGLAKHLLAFIGGVVCALGIKKYLDAAGRAERPVQTMRNPLSWKR
jgi:hypothetical protein